MQLSASRVLLTGATGGMGRAIVAALCARGAQVLVVGRQDKALQALVERNPSQVSCLQADLRQPADRASVLRQAQQMGDINLLINAAGINHFGLFENMQEQAINDLIETNLTGVWRVAKYATKAMMQAEVKGSIINIASITALRPSNMISAYSASKAAVDHLTRTMALEAARHGIRVNAIAPGYFKTAINDEFLDSEAGQRMAKRVPMRRFGNYEELNAPLLLLASEEGSYMTGSTLVVDGGHSLSPL